MTDPKLEQIERLKKTAYMLDCENPLSKHSIEIHTILYMLINKEKGQQGFNGSSSSSHGECSSHSEAARKATVNAILNKN